MQSKTTNMDRFEIILKELFASAIYVEDTIWFADNSTLFEAIMEKYDEVHDGRE